MPKPIFIAASPNSEKDDVQLAWSLIFKPQAQNNLSDRLAFEQTVSNYFEMTAVGFDSARSSFFALLKAFNFQAGDEVILPAFSCMVVANAAIWAGLKPVYADCDLKTYNYDLEDLHKKISTRTKAVMVQHSFGTPEDVAAIRKIVGPDVVIIEDLAHSLGGSLYGKKLGTLGDAAILTFGIEKVISGVRGGMALVKRRDVAEKLLELRSALPEFPHFRTKVALWNPVFWAWITPVYYFGLGKATLGRLFVWLGHTLGLFGNMIEDCEYDVVKPDWLPAKPSPALFQLAAQQFSKLDRFNKHRREIAAIYEQELGITIPQLSGSVPVFLRFPILVKDKQQVLQLAKKNKLVLGDWYRTILFSPERSLGKLGYTKGSCPNAEYCSKNMINLPTHIGVTVEDAHGISRIIKPYLL